MNKFIKENLDKDEKVIGKGKFNYTNLYVVIILSAVLILICAFLVKSIAIKISVALLLGILIVFMLYISLGKVIVITDKRVIGKTGGLNSNFMDVTFKDIVDAKYERTPYGYGTLYIHTETQLFKFSNVKNGDYLRVEIVNQSVLDDETDKINRFIEKADWEMANDIRYRAYLNDLDRDDENYDEEE